MAKGPSKSRKTSVLDETTEQAALVSGTRDGDSAVEIPDSRIANPEDDGLEETQEDLPVAKSVPIVARGEDELGEDEVSIAERVCRF